MSATGVNSVRVVSQLHTFRVACYHVLVPSCSTIFCRLLLLLMSVTTSLGSINSSYVDVYILGGQSNMAGRGGVTQSSNGTKVFDGIGPEPDPRVLCYNAAGRWVQAKEPMHADIDTRKVNGVGPGLIFAKELLSLQHSAGDEIGLVPCAIGATSMDEWLPGTVLYEKMVDRALRSVESYPNSDGKVVRLRGLLWYQGESDTESIEAVERFPSKLKSFFTTFWTQTGAPQDFIVQQVQVTCRITEATKYVEQLRHAQLYVGAGMEHPKVWTVDADGLAIKEDGVHLTRESQYIVGTALAQQHIAIIAGSVSPAVPWECVPDAG